MWLVFTFSRGEKASLKLLILDNYACIYFSCSSLVVGNFILKKGGGCVSASRHIHLFAITYALAPCSSLLPFSLTIHSYSCCRATVFFSDSHVLNKRHV